MVVLGLDCGGTNTRSLACDSEGREIYRGAGGPANIASIPGEALEHSLRQSIQDCPPVDFAAGCFAGLLTEADQQRAEALLKKLFPRAVVQAWPDYAAALAAVSEIDAIMICGTGSVCAWWEGRKIVKHGGGGPFLGDTGSAFALGRSLLSAALLSPVHRSPILIRYLEDRYRTSEMNEVVAAIYRSGQAAAEIAQAARVVIDEWDEGEAHAEPRIDNHLLSILMLLAPAAKAGARIGLAGGFWNLSPRLLPRMLEIDRSGLNLLGRNGVTMRPLAVEPVLGAVNLARQLLPS